MPVADVVAELEWGAQACGDLGSPLYEQLMRRAAEDAATGGIVADLLGPYAAEPRGSAMPLRLFGTVHRLALSGAAPELARYYPSCGGSFEAEGAWEAFVGVCGTHHDEVADGLQAAPQTNEVGRGAALRGGLQLAVAATGLPLRLFEIGASAGLNLLADRFRVGATDGGAADGQQGPADSPVAFPTAWSGDLPPDVDLVVQQRVGCDLAPVDPTTADGALRLQSYVWPDQVDRLERLQGAIELARRHRVQLHPEPAVDLLRRLSPRAGTVTVVQHSVMWQYLSDEERPRAQAELDRLRDQATPEAPVAHVALEPDRTEDDTDVDYGDLGFAVTWSCWPHEDERVVARAAPHGPPIVWLPRG